MNNIVKEADSENVMFQEVEFHAKQRTNGLRNDCLDQMQTDKMIEKHKKIFLEFEEEAKKAKQLAQEHHEMFLEFEEKMKNEYEIDKKELDSRRSEVKASHERMMDKLDDDTQKINILSMELFKMKPWGLKKSEENASRFFEDDEGINAFGDENNEAIKNKIKELNEELQQRQDRITNLKEQNQALLIKDRINMEKLQKVREELIKDNSSY